MSYKKLLAGKWYNSKAYESLDIFVFYFGIIIIQQGNYFVLIIIYDSKEQKKNVWFPF